MIEVNAAIAGCCLTASTMPTPVLGAPGAAAPLEALSVAGDSAGWDTCGSATDSKLVVTSLDLLVL